jgi:hypothetical protein
MKPFGYAKFFLFFKKWEKLKEKMGWLIQYTTMKAFCGNKVNYFINGNEFSLYTEDLITIMQIKVYHK